MAGIMLFFFGLAFGSFVNVLIDRLPTGRSVVRGRSRCDHCNKTLRWWELVPVVSFIFLRAKCARCGARLSVQYPVVELVTGVGFALLASRLWASPLLLFGYCLVFLSLLVIFVSDLKYQIIPDSMVIMGLLAAFGIALLTPEALLNHGASAVGAAFFFFLLWFGTRGRGMGFGDVKLALVLGMLLGYPYIVVGLYAAFLTGAGVGVILILSGKKKLKSRVSFGPFLIFGVLVAYIFGNSLVGWWHTLW